MINISNKSLFEIRICFIDQKGQSMIGSYIFVIGFLLLASLMIFIGLGMLQGLDLPESEDVVGSHLEIVDSESMASYIVECDDEASRGSDSCRTSLLRISEDINQTNIENHVTGDKKVLLNGKLINNTQVLLRVNSNSTHITVGTIDECNPWSGDDCNDIPCECATGECKSNGGVDDTNILGCSPQ